MTEEYRLLKGIDEKYAVSNLGNVKNIKTNHILSFEITNKGYKKVTLSINGQREKHYIHRLVATYFLNNPLNKPFVNHIDGVKTNNYIDNLEWCTQSENERHAFRMNLKTSNMPVRITNIKDNETKDFVSINDCAKWFNVWESTIQRLLKKSNPTSYNGYKIEFI